MDGIDVKTNVKRRLQSLGYTAVSSDDWAIDFIVDKVENYIRDNCNTRVIPESLFEAEVDIICGEFLSFKKNSGQLDIESLDFQTVEKSVQEGDTKVEFYVDGTMTDEQKLDALIKGLASSGKNQFVSYRCIKW